MSGLIARIRSSTVGSLKIVTASTKRIDAIISCAVGLMNERTILPFLQPDLFVGIDAYDQNSAEGGALEISGVPGMELVKQPFARTICEPSARFSATNFTSSPRSKMGADRSIIDFVLTR